MHSNRTHLIFWQPSGSALGYDPGYQTQFEQFLARVAADSRQPTNVYSLTGQYTDANGPAVYDSTYGGAVLAIDPLPANGCSEPPLTGPGWSVCLEDSQLESEIQHVVLTDHLPTTSRDVYFLVMPNGMGTCETTGPENCALGGGADGSFCGYHSSTPDGSDPVRRDPVQRGVRPLPVRQPAAEREHGRPIPLNAQPRAQRDDHRPAR